MASGLGYVAAALPASVRWDPVDLAQVGPRNSMPRGELIITAVQGLSFVPETVPDPKSLQWSVAPVPPDTAGYPLVCGLGPSLRCFPHVGRLVSGMYGGGRL